MFTHSFNLPDSFHVVAVQVATVWTTPESARNVDKLATGNPTEIGNWLKKLSKEEKLSLFKDNRIQSQALYGEIVLVTEVKGDWAKVVIPTQPSRKEARGYPGWIPLNQLKKVKREEWYRPEMVAIHRPSIWLEGENGEGIILLSYMTCLPIDQVKGARFEVITPHGKGYLPVDEVNIFPTKRGTKKGTGEKVVSAGESFMNLPYLWGGMSAFGYDCSGFTYTMHKANGYQISRDASDQAAEGKEVSFAELLPGDLLFFDYEEGRGNIHHVGIYTGGGKMLHAPSTGRGIEIITLEGTKYERGLCIARRYWEAGD